jgi:hypothetical protein
MAATSDDLVYSGATLAEIATIFGVSGVEARNRCFGIRPNGSRNGIKVYRIRDVAPKFVKVTEDAELVDRILRMKHTDLPKMLSKEYWAGKLAKQKYEMLKGDLWPTTKILEHVGGAYKTIRLSLMLMVDAVERETAFTEHQRRLLVDLIDTTLEDARERLQDGRSNRRKGALAQTVASSEDEQHADL